MHHADDVQRLLLQRELPTPELPEQTNTKIQVICDSLIGTKHDVMIEFANETQTGAFQLLEKVQRIVQRLSEPIGEMHAIMS